MIPGQKRNFSDSECGNKNGVTEEIQSQESTERLESAKASPSKVIQSPQDRLMEISSKSDREEEVELIEPQDNKRQKVAESPVRVVESEKSLSESPKLLDKSMTDSEQSSVHEDAPALEILPESEIKDEVDEKIKNLEDEI